MAQAAAYVDPNGNQFTSCTYYKYFSLDWKAFVAKLAGKKQPTQENAGVEPTPQAWIDADALARKALRALIHAAVFAVPSGKKKGHAHNNLPDAVLVEVKQKRIPTSYANAFLTPAVPSADSNPLEDSICKLGHYVGLVNTGYCLNPERFWFNLHQRPLTFTRPSADGTTSKAETLAPNQASFDALLDAVDNAIPALKKEAE